MNFKTVFTLENYSKAFKLAMEKGWTIKEIEVDANGHRQFVFADPNVTTEQDKAKVRMAEIKTWFADEYTKNEQKYRRLRTLGMKCDDGSDPYENLLKLYAESENMRKEFQSLEEVANGN